MTDELPNSYKNRRLGVGHTTREIGSAGARRRNSWALACARHSRHFVGFPRSETRVEHVNKILIASIVAELIEGKQDGFNVRRFLSVQRSLGGWTEDGSTGMPKDDAATASSTVADGDAKDAKDGASVAEGSGKLPAPAVVHLMDSPSLEAEACQKALFLHCRSVSNDRQWAGALIDRQ